MGLNTAGANPFGGLGVLGTGPVMLGNLPMAFGQVESKNSFSVAYYLFIASKQSALTVLKN